MAAHQSNGHKERSKSRRRVAIVAGLRSPFVKAGTSFKNVHAVELSRQVVCELLARTGLDPKHLDRLLFGQVVGHPSVPNIAREVGLAAGLPHTLDAYSVARACATSTQAMVDGAMAILCGDIDVALIGGVETLSRPPMTYQDNVVDALMAANAAKDGISKARALLRLRPKDLLPVPPALKEPSTGMTMGESAEKMAKENGIARADQDAMALHSHQAAARAWDAGIYDEEVMSIATAPGADNLVSKDGMVRADTSLEKLASLKPVFDRKHGSITAGNSSPLTDGAAALLLMEEGRARSLGYEPLAFLSSWAFAAVDPGWQLLAAPAVAVPKALVRAGTRLQDIDCIDMHEAFSAQVLSNIQHVASPAWQRAQGCVAAELGEVDRQKLNLFGGSIALGHPFAATGARQVLTMARELARRGHGRALITQCTAGGLGAAVVLER